MERIMTLAEIEKHYDSEWVLIGDPEYDKDGEVVRGNVVFHSKDRDEMYRKDCESGLRSAAYLYTGEIPGDAIIIL